MTSFDPYKHMGVPKKLTVHYYDKYGTGISRAIKAFKGTDENGANKYAGNLDRPYAIVAHYGKGPLDRHMSIGGEWGVFNNPISRAVKRKTRATTQRAAESYVRRPSQATKKAPSRRLKIRRTKNLQSPRGVFPNPVAAKPKGKFVYVKKSLDGKTRWTSVSYFPDTVQGKKDAIDYAKAYQAANPRYFVSVEK